MLQESNAASVVSIRWENQYQSEVYRRVSLQTLTRNPDSKRCWLIMLFEQLNPDKRATVPRAGKLNLRGVEARNNPVPDMKVRLRLRQQLGSSYAFQNIYSISWASVIGPIKYMTEESEIDNTEQLPRIRKNGTIKRDEESDMHNGGRLLHTPTNPYGSRSPSADFELDVTDEDLEVSLGDSFAPVCQEASRTTGI
ncbi:hypothetical protein K469DRAFT_746794 [Zopfia rhizophila CBS 207.26]|uniref:Uncharacterized protein n=1 Tax=Zopfia rhizophila CBS 207.26 TaxID=1314779 RepID=A0A6A6EL66_9PEZI|nr:hypothetical protein K469DRAFT_746794 [Zopfia rhizophila CBS 207.26]